MNRRQALKNILIATVAIPTLGLSILSPASSKTLEAKIIVDQNPLLLEIRKTLHEVYMNYIEANFLAPLDDISRHQLQIAMGEALDVIVSKRLVYDDFIVICNDSNNPPSVIDNNNLPVVDVFVKLTKSEKFYQITFGPSII